MKAIPGVIAVLICMWVLMLVGFVWYESKHPCLKYEDKLVHHDELTTMEATIAINLSTGEPVNDGHSCLSSGVRCHGTRVCFVEVGRRPSGPEGSTEGLDSAWSALSTP
jgi:hypothetical protein